VSSTRGWGGEERGKRERSWIKKQGERFSVHFLIDKIYKAGVFHEFLNGSETEGTHFPAFLITHLKNNVGIWRILVSYERGTHRCSCHSFAANPPRRVCMTLSGPAST